MKTSAQDRIQVIHGICSSGGTARAMIVLRDWLRENGYEPVGTDTRLSKLPHQRELVEEVRGRAADTTAGLELLEAWLVLRAYESSEDCSHLLVVRATGKCNACGTCVHMVTRPYNGRDHSATCVHCSATID